jgi:tetratricopeptide (TPR) repeat protein
MSKDIAVDFNLMNISSIDSMLSQGKTLFNNKQYREARDLYQKVINENPGCTEAYQGLDATLRAYGGGREALLIKLWQGYIEKNPNDSMGYYKLQKILVEQDKRFESNEIIAQYLRHHPNDYQAYLEQAEQLAKSGYFTNVASLYHRAIALNPDNYAAYHGLYDKAYATYGVPKLLYEQYIAKNPNNYQIYYDQARLLHNNGNYQRAIQLYDDYIKRNKDYYPAYFDKAKTLHEQGNYKQALSTLDTCISLKPEDYESYHQKAKTLFALGQSDLALAMYDQYIAKHIHYYQAYKDKAESLVGQNQYELAVKVWNSYIEHHPDHFPAYRAKAEIYNSQKQLYLAIKTLEEYQAIYPEDEQVYLTKGKLIMAYGCYMALADYSYSQAIDINPNNYDSHYTRSQIASSIGDDKKTVEIFDKYLKQNPSSYEAAYWKAIFMKNHMGLFDKQAIYQAFIDCMNIQPYNKKAVMAAVEHARGPAHFDAAIKYYDKYLEINPESRKVYLDKVNMLKSQEKHQEVESLLYKSIKLFPNNYEFYKILGQLLMKHNEVEKANNLVETIIQQNPDNYEQYKHAASYYLYVCSYADSDRETTAIKILERYIQLKPGECQAYEKIANIIIEPHNDDIREVRQAMKYFNKYLDASPNNDEKYLNVVGFLRNVSSWKRKMMGEDLSKNDTEGGLN